MRFAIIGGGLAGLMAARSLRVAQPDSEIIVIERSQELGGLLSGISYTDPDIYFDKGTHIFRETGNSEIDDFILNSIPSEELIHFDVGQGDVAGAVFDGRLQTNTHFPDIRHRSDYKELFQSLKNRTESVESIPAIDRLSPLVSGACDRFGDLYVKHVLVPVVSRLYQLAADELASFAFLLPGLTRVVGTDYADWSVNSNYDQYRALFAVPDQRQLPKSFQHGKRSFYSRHLGSRRFIDGVAHSLRADGITILEGITVTSLSLNPLTVTGCDSDGSQTKLKIDGLVIATGVIGAANLLDIDLGQFHFDMPMINRIVNLVVSEPVDSDLCYFYGLDESTEFYRVTNYRGFADDPTDKRLTIEVLGHETVDNETLPDRLIEQLKDIGFLECDRCLFKDVVTLRSGFPVPTTKNMSALTALSKHIDQLLPDNVICGGVGSKQGKFFQNEIVESIYRDARSLV